jgi:hypothetical protein
MAASVCFRGAAMTLFDGILGPGSNIRIIKDDRLAYLGLHKDDRVEITQTNACPQSGFVLATIYGEEVIAYVKQLRTGGVLYMNGDRDRPGRLVDWNHFEIIGWVTCQVRIWHFAKPPDVDLRLVRPPFKSRLTKGWPRR